MSAVHPSSLTVQVPLGIRRRPGRKTVVTPEGVMNPAMPRPAIQAHGDPALVKALARAFRYQRMLDEGRYASITEIAQAEELDRGYLGSCCSSPCSRRNRRMCPERCVWWPATPD